MNTLSRLITGTIAFTLGLVLTIVAFLNEPWILIYGIPLLIIGILILFNKGEDDIEKIKGGKNE